MAADDGPAAAALCAIGPSTSDRAALRAIANRSSSAACTDRHWPRVDPFLLFPLLLDPVSPACVSPSVSDRLDAHQSSLAALAACLKPTMMRQTRRQRWPRQTARVSTDPTRQCDAHRARPSSCSTEGWRPCRTRRQSGRRRRSAPPVRRQTDPCTLASTAEDCSLPRGLPDKRLVIPKARRGTAWTTRPACFASMLRGGRGDSRLLDQVAEFGRSLSPAARWKCARPLRLPCGPAA